MLAPFKGLRETAPRLVLGWALLQGGSLQLTEKPDASATPTEALLSRERSNSQPRSSGTLIDLE